ncbi:tyrosine-type recombinase/integrase [Alistipes finegoldii]|uniref:tyrosine-type recombinase/integrase n=1 Tax=Alistipes finegoldii TaxID=214856 RepID=UPI00242BF0B4|nr:tyrosine-type recombinase/integrase [Alistipes finegoldii]
MGRIKSEYPVGEFRIRRKPNAKGEVVIYLTYNVNSVAIPRSTGVRINPADWDDKKCMIRLKNPNAARLNNQLKQCRDEIDERIQKYDGLITPQVLADLMDGKYETQISEPKDVDFIKFAQEYHKRRYDLQKIAYSTYYNGSLFIQQFQRFIAAETGEGIILISNLSLDLIERYKAFRLKKGNTKEGINKMLTPLFKAVEYAKDNELLSIKVASTITTAYFDIKQRKYKSEVESGDIHYLTPEQLNAFINLYDKVLQDRTREIMDMFLFSFHACGLRVSDIITLEWSHIDWKACEIGKNLFKGNVAHTIPLTEPAIAILKRWQKKQYNKRFVFDLLPENYDLTNEADLDMRRKSKNRTIQVSLNALGYKIGLPFNLTMHVARHTFAVMALNRGISLHMISQLLGHGSIITTEKVYAQFLPDTINDAVRNQLAFGSFTPSV